MDGISLERAEHASALSKRELENLLKHGAYDIFREGQEDSADESARYYDDDIEKILQVILPAQLTQSSLAHHSTGQHSPAQHSSAQHSTAQHSPTQPSLAQPSPAQP